MPARAIAQWVSKGLPTLTARGLRPRSGKRSLIAPKGAELWAAAPVTVFRSSLRRLRPEALSRACGSRGGHSGGPPTWFLRESLRSCPGSPRSACRMPRPISYGSQARGLSHGQALYPPPAGVLEVDQPDSNDPRILESGAGNEARTRDLYLGKVPLYQLSYSRILGEGRIVCAGPAKSRQGAARGGENPWRTKGLRGQRLSSGHAARRYATMEMRVAAAASSVRTTPSG